MGGQIPQYELENLSFLEDNITDERIIRQFKLSGFKKEAKELIKNYPPNLSTLNKKIVMNIANNENVEWKGVVKFSRFSEMPIPKFFPTTTRVKHICQENVFTYQRLEGYDDSQQRDWHVNFADRHLFGYYGGSLFAQDEMQTAEMPLLASVREYLQSEEVKKFENPELVALTRNKEFASPCLIRNVQRRVKVSTDRNTDAGRPHGLYGNRFRMGSPDTIQKATKLFHNPQLENIIAMEAPKNQNGEYNLNTILFILKTSFTGFRAAKAESTFEDQKNITCIHTGNWGTGAYGGNKILMALIQIAAAELAGIDILVFHSFNQMYTEAYEKGKKYFEEVVLEKKMSVLEFVKWVEHQRFRWGVSDGN